MRVGFWIFLTHLGHFTLSSESVFSNLGAFDHTVLLVSDHQILGLGNQWTSIFQICRLSTATSDNNSALPLFRSVVWIQVLAIIIALPLFISVDWVQRQAIIRLVAGAFWFPKYGTSGKVVTFFKQWGIHHIGRGVRGSVRFTAFGTFYFRREVTQSDNTPVFLPLRCSVSPLEWSPVHYLAEETQLYIDLRIVFCGLGLGH